MWRAGPPAQTSSCNPVRAQECEATIRHPHPACGVVMVGCGALVSAGSRSRQLGCPEQSGQHVCEGLGVAQSDRDAIKWFMRAAVEGFPAAHNNLALMDAGGNGVPQSDLAAVSWYRKAVAQSYAPAESNLGFMYLRGRGVAMDSKEAAKLFRQAVKAGKAAAEYNLGLLYYYGSGVRRDLVQALKLFRAAAEHGSAEAQNQGVELRQWAGENFSKMAILETRSRGETAHHSLFSSDPFFLARSHDRESSR